MRKSTLATLVGSAAFLGALALGRPPANPHPDVRLPIGFRGIPMGTVLTWDNGKYVPVSVPGYESRADYPDSFWVSDPQNLP